MSHRVLFVDDERRVTEGLMRSLRKERYEILSANSAERALEILERERVDVVVSDEKMPGMCGSEFLAVVARDHPDSVRIILSGQASLESAVRAINEGQIYRFLLKPCNEVDLAVTIRQALQQRDLEVENRRLLKTVRRQSGLLRDLEEEHPGITHVKRSAGGTVVIDEEDCDPEAFVDEIGGGVKSCQASSGDSESE